MIGLPKVTLICVDCYSYGKSVNALQKSLKEIKPARVLFLTDIKIEIDGIEVVQIEPIRSKEQYSKFIVKELYKHFDTSHCLVIQHDGYVLNGDCWDDDFLKVDYIGAAWLEIDGRNVGNGGFSLRSKKLQEALGKDAIVTTYHHEDAVICRLYRPYLEKEYEIVFADEGLADKFSFELREPSCKTFGFHGNFHQPYQPTIIMKRSGAIGDIIIMEPVMRYYAAKGWNVVLDIPMQFFDLFSQHYFPVKHISQFDRGRIEPEKEIDFDLAYEVKPRQSYLKSYFEFAGIKDYKLTRPQLYPLMDDITRLFKKYVVIHTDRRSEDHRNVFGVNWMAIKRYLENKGFIVLQVSKNEHEECGLEINTPSVGLLKFTIAGASLFIGVDSAPSHIAVAYNIPSIIFFGSVCPDYIHADLTNIKVIQGRCDKSGCWHVDGSTNGKECFYKDTDKYLQCAITDSDTVIDAIDSLIIN